MAASFDLLLVSNCTESSSDSDYASSTIAALIAKGGALVYTDLSKNSIEIVNAAFDKKKFDSYFDTEWDPPKTINSIGNYGILSNDELVSFADLMGAHFETVNFDNYAESPEAYKPRIKGKLFEPANGLRVAVVTPNVIETCMELMGQRSEVTPLMSLWKIWPESQRGVLIKEIDDWTRAQEIVGSVTFPDLMSSFTMSTFLDQPPASTPPDLAMYANTSHLLEEQVTKLSHQFSSELGRELDSVLSTYRVEGAEPGEQVARHINSALSGLRNRFEDTLLKLEERLKDVDDFKNAQKTEIEQATREIRNIAAYQNEVSSLLQRLEDSLSPTVKGLQDKLAALETQQAALRDEITTAQGNKQASVYPLRIRKVICVNDRYMADIGSRKHYPVSGFVAILQEDGTLIQQLNQQEFRGSQQVDLTEVTKHLPSGRYHVVVLHYVDQSPISPTVAFEVQGDEYARTLLYREKDMTVVEETLQKERGPVHVQLLRKLAVVWQNPTSARLAEFLAVFDDRSVEGEEAIRARLRAQGFTV